MQPSEIKNGQNKIVGGPESNPAELLQHALNCLDLGQFDLALQSFDRLDNLAATFPQIMLGKAIALSKLFRVHEAIAVLEALQTKSPAVQGANELLNELRAAIGATRPAAPQFSPTSVSPVTNEAMALLSRGLVVEALRASEKSLRDTRYFLGQYLIHADCLEAVGRCEEALAAAAEELRLNPGNHAARSLYERLASALKQKALPAYNPEQRSYQSALPKPVLDSIQNASHNYAYRGVPMIKNPFDFALYPLLFWKIKPRTVIEIGTKSGGSAVWFGDMMNNFGIDGHIYSIDIVRVSDVQHPRVTFLEGNGRKLEELLTPQFLAALPRPLLVIEDADHSYETTSAVLKFFAPVLQPEEYIVIEDGIISDLSSDPDCNSGPHRGLKEFLANHPGEYDIDQNFNDYFGYNFTWCTNGFLRKKKYALNPIVPRQTLIEFNTCDPAPLGVESQMSQNERFQLFYAMRNLLPSSSKGRAGGGPLRFVEIGSYSGASLALTHAALTIENPAVEGYSVEPGGMPQFYEVLQALGKDVTHIKMFSHQAAPSLKQAFDRDGNLPEVIFVDGDHSYEGVKRDALDYYPLLAQGGLMIFHDYLPPLNAENREAILFHHGQNEPGIRRACEEVMEQTFGCKPVEIPLLYPNDPTQTQPHLPVIPGVFSTLRCYRKA